MKKLVVILCMGIISVNAMPYVCKSIDGFIKQMVPEGDRKKFRTYYQKELQSLRISSPEQRTKLTQEKNRKGLAALEVKYPELYKHLQCPEYTLCMRGKQEVARTIMRLGCYEEYCAVKAELHANLFTRFRNYTQNIRHSVAHWFGRKIKKSTT